MFIIALLGLTLLCLGVAQGWVTRRRLRGLSLTGSCWTAGYGLAAGLVMVGLAIVILTPLPFVIVCALPAFLSTAIALFGISSIVNHGLQPPDARRPAPDDPWQCEEVTFADGDVETRGLFLRPRTPNGATICWVHGTGDDKAKFKWVLLRELTRRGFTVFTFDLPGHGEHPRPFSLPQALTAVPSAMAYLTNRPDINPDRLGVMGVSLGGALTIRALADGHSVGALCLLEIPCSVRVTPSLYVREAIGAATLQAMEVFADCSPFNLLHFFLTQKGGLFVQSLEQVFDFLAPARYISSLPSLPLLIVYGGRDAVAPPDHAARLFHSARPPKEKRCIRPASHVSLIFMSETAHVVGEWFEQVLGRR